MSTATNPVLNPSPKTRFLSSDQNVGKHRDMVDSNEFQRAADFALMEYQAILCQRESNPAVLGMKIMGAQEFLQTLRLLSEKVQVKPAVKIMDNLQDQ